MKSFVVLFFSAVFFGGIGILCTIWAVVTLGRREYMTVIVVLGLAVFCLAPVFLLIMVQSGRVTPRGEFDSTRTTVRPDRGVDVITQVWVFAGVTAMGVFAVFEPLGKLDLPIGREQRYSVPLMGAAVAVMGLPILWRNVKRGGTKYLRLTPDGFEFSQGSSSPSGAWAQVEDVTDRPPEKPPLAYSAIVMVMSDGQTPTLAVGSFTPDGQALRQMVRFYWQHPERRTELTDGRALERLHDEQFEAE